MEIFYSLLLYQLITLKFASSEIPQILSFNVVSDQNEEVEVNLVPVESFLANENVPVYTPNKQFPNDVDLVKNVMELLTPFTIYQDSKTCATAVFYHHQQKLHGMVGHHHFIKSLHYNVRTRKVEPTIETVFLSPFEKHNEKLSENNEIWIAEDEGVENQWDKSLREYPQTIFVETLVIINYDITQQLRNYNKAIAMFVLTLMNNVDMIFSEIQIPNIKINIAGIIIGTEHGSFPKLIKQSCYDRDYNEGYEMDADCVIDAIQETLFEYKTVPFRSYDIVLFLTRYDLFEDLSRDSKPRPRQKIKHYVNGRARMPLASNGYRLSSEDITFAVVSNPNIDQLLPTTAHEIAHMLGVLHDHGPLWRMDRMCDAHLMKQNDHVCKRCFKFGGSTLDHFREFFGSRQACIFHNKPRSLNRGRPRLFWNEEEQCRCYGYPYVDDSMEPSVNCKSHLKCVSEHGNSHHTGLFMDGTPCDSEKTGTKVCWNTECLPVQDNSKLSLQTYKLCYR